MTEDALKARINRLEKDLERKEIETNEFLDKIDEQEETIMRLEALIPEESEEKKSKKKQATDSKLAIKLDAKEKKIRDLKNSMGFLRKEKVRIQQELELLKSQSSESSVIRVEDLRKKSPLNALVQELQDKVNNQRALISKLRSNNAESDKFIEKLKVKDEEIKLLNSDILKAYQKLEDLSSVSENKKGDSIGQNLIGDLQNQLNKSKREIIELKQKFSKKTRNEIKENNSSDIDGFKKELHKAKLQIKSLQEQLKKYETRKTTEIGKPQKELEGNLKMQSEMAIFLQKQLETKEGEIKTIKNEAVQIKRRYRQLENRIKLKDQKINELQIQLDNSYVQKQALPQKEDPHVEIRLKEFKSILDNLKKENIEQRLEISQLRKKV
ncbi:hypothetical protein LCGC14_0561630 [marine sediment metagenome]|uniref:Uncharacterized protein n=1 Tax=marine sediment metagenome TaxID=412755 RepID=A0A0F9U8B1_9ZZZZ